jgi:hypothetical protein
MFVLFLNAIRWLFICQFLHIAASNSSTFHVKGARMLIRHTLHISQIYEFRECGVLNAQKYTQFSMECLLSLDGL